MADGIDIDKYDAPSITEELSKADQKREVAKTAAKARGMTAKRRLKTVEVFEDIVDKYGDPLVGLAEVAWDPTTKPELRVKALTELAAYGHGKIKTVEHTGANGEPLEFKMTLVQQVLEMLPTKTVNTIEHE